MNFADIINILDEILSSEGLLENTSEFSFSKTKKLIKMESKFEILFKEIKTQKENEARIRMIKEIDEINRLKREKRYFDNSISSDLYSKVLEAVDDITEDYDEKEEDNDNNMSNKGKESGSKGMKLQMKKNLVDNLMQIREDSIKMSIYFIKS